MLFNGVALPAAHDMDLAGIMLGRCLRRWASYRHRLSVSYFLRMHGNPADVCLETHPENPGDCSENRINTEITQNRQTYQQIKSYYTSRILSKEHTCISDNRNTFLQIHYTIIKSVQKFCHKLWLKNL